MDGPEQLETGPVRRSPARRWVVVAIVLLVVGGLGAIRFGGLAPDPVPPSVPSTGPSRAPFDDPRAWPTGLGSGTLFALDQTGVVVIDVASGLAQRSSLDLSATAPQLTAARGGVLVWPSIGPAKIRFVGPGTTQALDVSGLVGSGRAFWPANGSVWVSSRDPTTQGRSTWRLVDELDGVRARASVETRGDVVGDGSGGLFDVTDFRVRHVVPGSPTTAWQGVLLAVGPDGYETQTCTADVCSEVIHDRATGAENPVYRPVSPDLGLGALSPGNRFVATIEPLSTQNSDTPSLVRVAEPGASKVIRSFPAQVDDQEVMTWLSDRWLVAGGRDGIVFYDAVADRVVTPALDVGTLSGLVFQPA